MPFYCPLSHNTLSYYGFYLQIPPRALQNQKERLCWLCLNIPTKEHTKIALLYFFLCDYHRVIHLKKKENTCPWYNHILFYIQSKQISHIHYTIICYIKSYESYNYRFHINNIDSSVLLSWKFCYFKIVTCM